MCIFRLGENGLKKDRLAKKWEQFKIVLLFMDHPVPIGNSGTGVSFVDGNCWVRGASCRQALTYLPTRLGGFEHYRLCVVCLFVYSFVGI